MENKQVKIHEAGAYPFIQDMVCSYCELEVVTKHAWDDKIKPSEQMCIYCQREIQS